jgi:hypothetical protein
VLSPIKITDGGVRWIGMEYWNAGRKSQRDGYAEKYKDIDRPRQTINEPRSWNGNEMISYEEVPN